MSWLASEIYTEALPTIILTLCSNVEFSNDLYLLNDLHQYNSTCELLVARDIGQYRGMPILWDSIYPLEGISAPIIIPERGTYDALPPPGFLQFLKWLSQSTNTWVSYYFHQTWGGSDEVEFSFVFGSADKVYVLDVEDSGGIIEYSNTGKTAILADSVLQLTLKHYNITLQSRYFEPHTRSFHWEIYKLHCSNS